MKIVSLSSCFPSPVNPTAGIFVQHRLAAIARKGADLEVVHPMATCPLIGRIRDRGVVPRSETRDGMAVFHRPFAYLPGLLKPLDGYFYYRGLIRWMEAYWRRRRPDLLDAHFAWPDGVGVSYLARHLGLPYTVTLRGTINPRYKVPCFRKRIADALGSAAAVISVSRPMAFIAAELGTPEERIHLIPNGVDASFFAPTERGKARRALGLPMDVPLVVSVASLKPAKGHGEMVDAFSRLPGDAHLVIVGAQTDRGGYLQELNSLVREKGLARRVVFAGSQPHSRMPLYFSAADVSALASHSEGCPNVVLESLACGTPVVATSVGAVPDLVTPGANGQVVPPRDPEALADALQMALAAPWSRDAIRQSVENRSWESVAHQVLSVFESVLATSCPERM